MRLFLYGGNCTENLPIERLSLEMTGKKSPRITFIPPCSYDSDQDFKDFVEYMGEAGFRKFLHFPIDVHFDHIMEKEALSSDIIHLGGGNTYYFLKHLRQSGMQAKLKQFVKRGGILTGLSAGAIVMTPTIHTAGFPSFDKDDNDERIKNLKGMGLVKFEFFPHYKNSKRYDEELFRYSKMTGNPVYACPDGSGIVMEQKSIRFFGRAFCFYRGKKINLYNQTFKSAA